MMGGARASVIHANSPDGMTPPLLITSDNHHERTNRDKWEGCWWRQAQWRFNPRYRGRSHQQQWPKEQFSIGTHAGQELKCQRSRYKHIVNCAKPQVEQVHRSRSGKACHVHALE